MDDVIYEAESALCINKYHMQLNGACHQAKSATVSVVKNKLIEILKLNGRTQVAQKVWNLTHFLVVDFWD
jgi:hypothetical protein